MRLTKAIFVTSFPPLGTVPQHIQVANLPEAAVVPPRIKGAQVLVENKASILTRDDVYIAQKSFAGGFPFLQVPEPTPDNPLVLGCEFAGIVRALGPDLLETDVSLRVGNFVCGFNDIPNQGHKGTWTEQVLTEKKMIVKFDPKKLTTFCQAAAFVLPAVVSTAMLEKAGIDITRPKRPETSQEPQLRCLVVGAAGSIGCAMTKILSTCPHIHVTGVCSSLNIETVLEHAANDVYDYQNGSSRKQLQDSGKSQFDVVLDLVGGMDIQQEAMDYLLKPTMESRFVTCVGPFRNVGSRVLSTLEQAWFVYHLFLWMPFNNVFRQNKPKYFFIEVDHLSKESFQAVVDAGIEPMVEKIVPFEKEAVREALEYVMSSTPKSGRVALAISPDADQTIVV
jgi:NADPH:quinone reductase-like Zn-dependent oxidoreductase